MDQIKSRATIAAEGRAAAVRRQENPYPAGTDAHSLWAKARNGRLITLKNAALGNRGSARS